MNPERHPWSLTNHESKLHPLPATDELYSGSAPLDGSPFAILDGGADSRRSGVAIRDSGVGSQFSGVTFRSSRVALQNGGAASRFSGVTFRNSGAALRFSGASFRFMGVDIQFSGVASRFSGVNLQNSGVSKKSSGFAHFPVLTTDYHGWTQIRDKARQTESVDCGDMSPLSERGHVRALQIFRATPPASSFYLLTSTFHFMKKTKKAAATSTTTGTPGPAPAPAAKPVIHRGLLDKHQLAEISLTNTIYGIASDPATLALIEDPQVITPAFMATLGADLQGMSQFTGGTSQAVIDAQQDTGTEASAKKTLLAKIHYIQSKAKIKYMGNKGVLPEYGIGTNIDISRPALETASGNVINKLKTDTLPKITAQHSTDLQAALDDYKKTKVAQVGGKGDSTSLRVKLTTMVESVAVRRRQLQHAADGEFPYTDPANAGMRKKFDLPPNQPLSV